MSTIHSTREPRTFPNPVSTAQAFVQFQPILEPSDHDGVRFPTLRSLLTEANGPGSRKRVGYFRNSNTQAIVKLLADRDEAAYFPRAEAELRSRIEDGRLRVPINKSAEVLAMLPGDHVVVVVSKTTDLGVSLLEGRSNLVYDRDGDRRHDTMEQVQRANALDVLAVLAMVEPTWGGQ